MDAALGFGGGNPLNAMGTGLELEPGVDALALHPRDDLLVAALLAVAGTDHLDLPALVLGVARVHAKQVAGEQRRFVTAGSRAHLEKDVTPIIGILGHQQTLEFGLQLLELGHALLALHLGELAHVGVGVLGHLLCGGHVFLDATIAAPGVDQRLELGVFAGVVAKTWLIADHVGLRQQGREFLEAVDEGIEALTQRSFHRQILEIM